MANGSEKHEPSEEPAPVVPPQIEPEATNVPDSTRDFSKVPQSELTSRVPSVERICLSPLCQSGIPSGCQTPHEGEVDGKSNFIISLVGSDVVPFHDFRTEAQFGGIIDSSSAPSTLLHLPQRLVNLRYL